MILRLEQMVAVALAALGGAVLLHNVAMWRGDDMLAIGGPIGVVVLAIVWLWPSIGAYRYYDSIGLIRVNSQLSLAILMRARPGEVIQRGGQLYYRSRGRNRHHTPWPRLWVMPLNHLAAMQSGETRRVAAQVFWPVPFFGGMRYRREVSMQVDCIGDNVFSLHAYPLRRRQWARLAHLDHTELLALYQDATAAHNHMSAFNDDDRIGNSHRFRPRWQLR